jgi:hypothetical protein
MTKSEVAGRIASLETQIKKEEDGLRLLKPKYRPVREQEIQAMKFQVAELREQNRVAAE